MTLIDRNKNELNRGDLVLVSYSNHLQLGIVAGIGSANNLQFYSLNTWNVGRLKSGKKLYKSYVNTSYESRLAKYSVDLLSDEDKQIYNEMMANL